LLAASVRGQALRSMTALGTAYDNPVFGKDPQPARMRDYVDTQSDHGRVLTTFLKRRTTFQTAANATFHVAGTLFGAGSHEQQSVSRAWTAVDITVK
jgi:Zn-dependent metalloprotease